MAFGERWVTKLRQFLPLLWNPGCLGDIHKNTSIVNVFTHTALASASSLSHKENPSGMVFVSVCPDSSPRWQTVTDFDDIVDIFAIQFTALYP